jgi:Na+/H+ antiporter NhaB
MNNFKAFCSEFLDAFLIAFVVSVIVGFFEVLLT